MKTRIIIFLMITLGTSFGFARPKGPELTDTQNICLKSELVSPDESKRPSRAQMQQAFENCGIEAPPHRRDHKPELSDEQKQCMNNLLGDPESSKERPTREQVENALENCNVERPVPPPHFEQRANNNTGFN